MLKVLIALLLVPQITLASESDFYNFSWLDQDKEIYVLQNRKFRKANRAHLDLGGGITTSGAFVDAYNLQVRAGYFIMEDWGLQFLYSKNDGDENSTAESIRKNASGSGSIPFRRIVDSYWAAMGVLSPFYSKINTFNTIIYVDWLLGIGYASLEETNNRTELNTGGGSRATTTETHGGISWNLGAKIYLTETWSLRLDVTAVHYRAKGAAKDNPSDIWYSHYDLTASAGVSF